MDIQKAIDLSKDNIVWDKNGVKHTINYTFISYVGGKAQSITFETIEGIELEPKDIKYTNKDVPAKIKIFSEAVEKLGLDPDDQTAMRIFEAGFNSGQKSKLIHSAEELLQK
jgi:hypothetical protein